MTAALRKTADRTDEMQAVAKVTRAELRMCAWRRVLDAVGDMRGALELRIARENPDDVDLEADARAFCELARALSDFLRARRAA